MLAELLFPRKTQMPSAAMESKVSLTAEGRSKVSASRQDLISKSFGAAFFYGASSISLNFINKAVLSGFGFNFPFFIMTSQMAANLVLYSGLGALGLVSNPSSLRSVRTWSGENASFMWASLAFALHSALSLYALHGMNIPMYGAIKRCTPIVSLVMSVLILKKAAPSNKVVFSVLVISTGIILASAGDLEFEWRAYTTGILSVFAQASYLTLVQKASMERKRSAFEMVYANSFNTLPLFAAAALVTGEPRHVINSEAWSKAGFYPTFILLVISANLLTYSQFLCTSVCSALTTSLVGVGKSVIQTIIGFFTFGGVTFHPLNVTGLALNLLGGAIYSYAKLEETKSAKNNGINSSQLPVMDKSSNCLSKSKAGDSVTISVDDLMTSRVVKIRTDMDKANQPRKVM